MQMHEIHEIFSEGKWERQNFPIQLQSIWSCLIALSINIQVNFRNTNNTNVLNLKLYQIIGTHSDIHQTAVHLWNSHMLTVRPFHMNETGNKSIWRFHIKTLRFSCVCKISVTYSYLATRASSTGPRSSCSMWISSYRTKCDNYILNE